MKKTLMITLVGAALAVPAAAVGQATVMVMMAPPANAATIMCRPATSTEKPNATAGSTGLTCKAIAMQNGQMQIPDTSKMNRADADASWRRWVMQSVQVPLSGNGGG
ncbi:MAG TPA: hypothetical protein VGN14_04535 [Candidatus Elarobacter sp.]|jgi:hypothetical protein